MEIKDFIKTFAEQFEETDTSNFVPETKFKELEEWNSLTVLGTITMAQLGYNVKITGSEIRNLNTIQDLFNLIKSKQNS